MLGGRVLSYTITGGRGTGKTFLIYAPAKTLYENFQVTIVHCGMLCEGHDILNKRLKHCDPRSKLCELSFCEECFIQNG